MIFRLGFSLRRYATYCAVRSLSFANLGSLTPVPIGCSKLGVFGRSSFSQETIAVETEEPARNCVRVCFSAGVRSRFVLAPVNQVGPGIVVVGMCQSPR